MQELTQDIASFWIWLALACILLAIEVLVVPTGFFLCLGSSAAVLALVVFFVPELTWLWSVSLYSALMVLSCLFWWKVLRRRRGEAAREETETLNVKTRQLVGYSTVLTEAIKAGRGRIRVNDSAWPVEADEDYPAGTRVEVLEVNGITLKVKAVQ